MNAKHSVILLSLLLSPITTVADVAGKYCGLKWDAVPDPRVTGYRIFVDGVKTSDWIKETQITCDAAKIPKKKEVKVHVTAVGSYLESPPSNVLTLYYDDSPLIAPGSFSITVIGSPAE